MILFEEDWTKRHTSAFPNFKTTNTSFLRLAGLYKKMGIKNNVFHLALHDKDLLNVDPFAEDLDHDTIAKILVESKVNFWYYLREIARIPASVGVDGVTYKCNRGNIASYWSFFNHITYISIQIRQTGKSITSDTLTRWLLNIRCTNTDINILTKDSGLRRKNMERVKEMEKLLPWYMQLTDNSDFANTEMLSVKALHNAFVGHVPRSSPNDALKVGRGFTSPIMVNDEGPFQPNVSISMPAALAAGSAARDLAEERGEPYGTIFTTTAGSTVTDSGKYIYELLMNSAEWTEAFLDTKNNEHLEKVIRGIKGTKRLNITFNHRQLGYSDAWLKRKIEETESTEEGSENILADFFNVWGTGNTKNPLSKGTIKIINNSVIDPFHVEIGDNNYVTRWYISEQRLENSKGMPDIVLGADTSDGIGKDAIALHYRSVTTGETLGTGEYNETNLISFAQWLFEVMMRYPTITLIMERKSSGATIIDYLIKMFLSRNVNPFSRMFNWVVDEHEENPERYKDIDVSLNRIHPRKFVEHKKHIGYATAGAGKASRDNLYGKAFNGAIKYTSNSVKDKSLSNQLLTLTEKNGRIDHPDGAHDDLCVAWLLTYWFLTYGRNLNYYGIDHRTVLSRIDRKKKKASPEETYDSEFQIKIRQEINDIVTKLQKTRDKFMASMLERRMRALSSKIKLSENELFNVDTLLNELSNYRKNNDNK